MSDVLTTEQVNAIWELLDRAGAEYSARHGAETVRQSDVLEEILGIVAASCGGAWTREQILEAWMHQALTFIHKTTGRFHDPSPNANEHAALWNAISKAEHDFATARLGEAVRLDAYVDGVIDLVRQTDAGRLFGREKLFRAWVLKRLVDDFREAETPKVNVAPTKPGAALS